MRFFYLVSAFIFYIAGCLPMQGQEGYIRDDRDVIFQIFVGEVPVGDADEVFKDLESLGFLRPFSISNPPMKPQASRAPRMEKVYVGPYIGFATVAHMLQVIRAKGYIRAQIEGNEITLTSEVGCQLTHTVQLGAFEHPPADYFDHLAYLPAYGIHIVFEEGLYKVFSGLYREDQEAYIEEVVIPYWKENWGFQPFFRPFRMPYKESP
ncbi:MAG: hypothetical protein AAFW00_18410 [Bacteroidota bacterium]